MPAFPPAVVDARRVDRLPDGLPHDLRAAAEAGLLLRVVVGSGLHGFAHAGSDHDSWVVVSEPRDHTGTLAARKVFQGIDELEDGTRLDVTVVGLSTFLHYCAAGSPQALEVMFAPDPQVDRLGAMRHAYRAGTTTATSAYRRQLRTLVAGPDTPKHRRHAFRLALNLADLQATGRFNPALTATQRAWVLDQAASSGGLADRLEQLTGMHLRP